MIFSLFINNRHGSLIFHRTFSPAVRLTANDEIRLASTFHGLSAIAAQLSPVPPPPIGPLAFLQAKGISFIETDSFHLHCLETLTGLKFVIVADPQQRGVDGYLRSVYDCYANFVLKNPFYDIDMPIRCELFDREIGAVFSHVTSSSGGGGAAVASAIGSAAAAGGGGGSSGGSAVAVGPSSSSRRRD